MSYQERDIHQIRYSWRSGIARTIGALAVSFVGVNGGIRPMENPTAKAYSSSSNTIDSPFCVATHLDQLSPNDVNRQIQLMEEAGIGTTRFDFPWEEVQRQKGSWDFSRFDSIVNKTTTKGIKVIALLNINEAPPWEGRYDAPIKTPDKYAAYVGKVATYFKGRIPYYELGNEVNASMTAEEYVKYLKAGDKAIKAADPNAQVISSGISNLHDPRPWVTSMYTAGAKGYFDYLGDHPYSQPDGPKSLRFTVMQDLEEIMNNNGDKNKKIMATEFGWPTAQNNDESVSQATQADDITQAYGEITNYDL